MIIRPDRAVVFLVVGLCLAACASQSGRQDLEGELAGVVTDFVVIPGVRLGPVHPGSSASSLIDRYGQRYVVDGEIHVGEGETVLGTVLFPDTESEIEIIWHTADHRCPRHVIIRGQRSPWSTVGGVGLGVPMSDVATENAAPFTFWGFDWDYEGYVLDWGGGHLDGLSLRFGFPEDGLDRLSGSELQEIGGMVELRSDDPKVRALNPIVRELGIGWTDEAAETRACIRAVELPQ